jgi:dTDP-4-dehydrorhamnose reductase
MKVLVLGVTGMLGNAMFRVLSEQSDFRVFGSARNASACQYFPEQWQPNILGGVDVENHDSLVRLFGEVRPDVVINCVGLVKQLADADDPLQAIPINALLPHRLAALCRAGGARFIHISTDCVFSGTKGGYLESDFADADDLYGRSKFLGEVAYPHSITLRTSIIGHELSGARSLVNWFLAQQGTIKGFTRAVFSGQPTVVLAGVVRDHVLPRPDLSGLYHVAAAPINKHDLLRLVAQIYRKDIEIVADERLVIDRSLDASRFREVTGYRAPSWEEMIQSMYDFQ